MAIEAGERDYCQVPGFGLMVSSEPSPWLGQTKREDLFHVDPKDESMKILLAASRHPGRRVNEKYWIPREKQSLEYRPLIGLLVGGSGSGKDLVSSLLTNVFKENLSIVSHDRYYGPNGELRSGLRMTLINYDDASSLDSNLAIQHLRWLREGWKVLSPGYDFEAHERASNSDGPIGKDILVQPAPIILFQGILVAEAARRAGFEPDFCVATNTNEENRVKWRIKRDQRYRGRGEEEIQLQLTHQVLPAHEEQVQPNIDWIMEKAGDGVEGFFVVENDDEVEIREGEYPRHIEDQVKLIEDWLSSKLVK